MSDSGWPHRRQPTRLPSPWDSPGKNTGVGCHFLLQCMKVKSESQVAQSCLTLRDPMDRSLPDSSIHGIFQARVLEWGAIAFSCFHSRFLLNTVLHFQQSTTEAEISLPYLTAKDEQKKLRVLIKIMKTHAILILFLLHHYHWLIFTSLKYVWKYRKNRPGRGN